jgi:hypothetical protein
LLRTPQRRRKAAWETTSSASGASGGGVAVAAAAGSSQNVLSPSAESVTQSQHITVELSAAIKLLEQTLSQWAEEEAARRGGGKVRGRRTK